MKNIFLGMLLLLYPYTLLHGAASHPPTPPPVPHECAQSKPQFNMRDEIREGRQRDMLHNQRFQRLPLSIPIIFLPEAIIQREWRKRIKTMNTLLTFHFHNPTECPLDLLPDIMKSQYNELMYLRDGTLPQSPQQIEDTTPPLADSYAHSSSHVPYSQKSAYAHRLSQSMHESPSSSRNPSGKNTPQRILSCEDIAAITRSAPPPHIIIKHRPIPCADATTHAIEDLPLSVGFIQILIKFGKAAELVKSLVDPHIPTILHTPWGTPPQIALESAIRSAEKKIKQGKYTETECHICNNTPIPEETDGLYQTCIHLLLEYGAKPSCVHDIPCTHEGIKKHLQAALAALAGSAADA